MYGTALRLENICKKISDLFELKNINFSLNYGEVHSLIGENGAGKTELMNIIAGIQRMDSGEIFIDEKPVQINSTSDAKKCGIFMIHQDTMMFENFTVAENVFMENKLYQLKHLKIIDWNKINLETQRIFDELNFPIDSRAVVKNLDSAQKQLISIARAYNSKAKIIIMDEPSSSLNESEVALFFNVIKKLKDSGKAILYISHRIDEIKKISDRISVIRNGEVVGTEEANHMSIDSIIYMMTNFKIKNSYPKLDLRLGKEVFKVSNMCVGNVIKGINFSLRKREILGITGFMGSGVSEVAKALFGIYKMDTGEITICGREIKINNPHDAIKNGIGFLTDDRNSDGLFMYLKISENITSSSIEKFTNNIFIDVQKERIVANNYVDRLCVKFSNVDDKVSNLSGGNQQKVILAKLLLSNIKYFILNEPTRGIDVASKVDVYNLMNSVILNNASIILVSSDIKELVGMCDRILVLCDGKISANLNREDISEKNIMYYATRSTV